ncbi:hypothetical protein HanIR_Chr14g0699861 [Helianthus annuus]|nr:hypothetical protein HanIR_Chr14g0699861 [Helianthus annuus]
MEKFANGMTNDLILGVQYLVFAAIFELLCTSKCNIICFIHLEHKCITQMVIYIFKAQLIHLIIIGRLFNQKKKKNFRTINTT